MMKHKHCLILCLFLVYGAFASPASALAEPASVMVFPLAIHAESPMDYLQTGVCDLMLTKLAEKNIVTSRAPSVLPREDAVKQAQAANMDALIMGSLTFLGDSVSITITLIDSARAQNLIVFSKVEEDKSRLFSHANDFINSVTGEKPESPAPNVSGALPETPDVPALSEQITRSEDIKAEIVAICVGDTDGDGKKDVVLADIHSIVIMNLVKGSFTQSALIKGESYLNILHVDTFDTNGNGRDEIIATAVHARSGNPLSYAYEWDGSQYMLIAKSMDWFFKKGPCPFSDDTALLGQQQDYSSGGFVKALSVMGWDSGKKAYTPQRPCSAPCDKAPIYAYATGDVMNTGNLLTIIYTESDYLSILDSSRDDIWTSSERFGGSRLYLETKRTTPPVRYYLSSRVETGDFNQDGRADVVTLKNKNANPRMFSNLRNFVEGQVICLSWKSLDFETLWASPNVSGYISDFTITDLDKDGLYDLLYCVMPKKTSFFGKKTSYLVLQSINKTSP